MQLTAYVLFKCLWHLQCRKVQEKVYVLKHFTIYGSHSHLTNISSPRFMSFRNVFLFLTLAPLLMRTTARSAKSKYISIGSVTCEALGLVTITDPKECGTAAKALNYTVDESLVRPRRADIADGCTIGGSFVPNPFHRLFSQKKGTCVPGHDAPDSTPELNGKANCLCSRFQPCICKRAALAPVCPGSEFAYVNVNTYDGPFHGEVVGRETVCAHGCRAWWCHSI